MGSLTIRNLDDVVKAKLHLSAASNGVSMEQEAKRRLRERLSQAEPARKKLTVAELLQYSVKPEVPFDLKKISDELPNEGR